MLIVLSLMRWDQSFLGRFLIYFCPSSSFKTLCYAHLPDKMTYLGQKFCVVVYPGESSGGAEEGEEMKEARSPLSKEEGDNHKSADC